MQQQQPKHTELNSAQLAAVNDAIKEIVARINLRQWCVERALTVSSPNPVELASNIYSFIVGPEEEY